MLNKGKKMIKVSLIAAGLFLSSCAMLGPKPQETYHRKDLNRPVVKVIVFPITDFNGVQDAAAQSATAAYSAKWAELYGQDKVIPGGPIILKIIESTGKDTYKKILQTTDNISAMEQTFKDPKIKSFIETVTSKLGKYHFAVGIMEASEKAYDDKNPVKLHIGLFDSGAMTWKWITKIEDKKSVVGNFNASVMMMVNNSFDLIDTIEKAQIKKD